MSLQRTRADAYRMFDALEVGQVIIIKNETSKPEVLIQYGKDYIDCGGDLEFSGDYKKIRKLTPMSELLESEKKFLTK